MISEKEFLKQILKEMDFIKFEEKQDSDYLVGVIVGIREKILVRLLWGVNETI